MQHRRLVVPEPFISEAPLVPGLDGHKMSKSRGNGIPLFAPAKQLRKIVMKIVTGSEGLDDPKEPDGSTVYELYKLVAPESDVNTMAGKLRAGGYGWGHAKQDLYDALEGELGPRRKAFDEIRGDEAQLDRILEDGSSRARVIAQATLKRARVAIGLPPSSAR